jgi:hypothetical protein
VGLVAEVHLHAERGGYDPNEARRKPLGFSPSGQGGLLDGLQPSRGLDRCVVTMYNGAMKRTNIFLADEDMAAIARIRARYGLSTSSDAIRFALRVVAQGELAVTPPPALSPEVSREQGPGENDRAAMEGSA